MKLRKDLVDELIRITKKYYRTGKISNLPAVSKAKDELELKCKASFAVVMLIDNLAMFTQFAGRGTYEDIYKALEVFGVMVE